MILFEINKNYDLLKILKVFFRIFFIDTNIQRNLIIFELCKIVLHLTIISELANKKIVCWISCVAGKYSKIIGVDNENDGSIEYVDMR